jgi:hypothetical protein
MTYDPSERFTFLEIATVVAENFGSTSAQSITRCKKLVNRAAERLVGHGRKWSWTKITDTFDTVADQAEYSLNDDVRKPFLFALTGSTRGKLECMPDRSFVEAVPDADETSGSPTLWRLDGVDSNGQVQIALWPVPDAVYTVQYKYWKQMEPMVEDDDDVRSKMGLPAHMLEVLIQIATALSFKGIDDARYNDDMAEAMAMLDAAYADDQDNPDVTIRAPERTRDELTDGEPIYPSNYGR